MKRQLEKQFVMKYYRRAFIIGIVIVSITLFFIFNRDLFNLLLAGEVDEVRTLLEGRLLYAYTFMLFVMIVQNSFTVVPLILVISINLTLFGVVNGFLWSWATSVIAGSIVFFCVRHIFQDWLLERFDPQTLKNVEHRGFIYVFQARVFPFVPTSLINILAGISSIRFRHFLMATSLGNFLYFFVLALVPAGLLTTNINEYEMGMILFLAVSILFVLKKFYDRKQKKKKAIQQPIQGQQIEK